MTVYVNDQPVTLKEQQTVTQLLKQYDIQQTKGVAVAVNEEVTPKSDWEQHQLQADDQILLITASQGG